MRQRFTWHLPDTIGANRGAVSNRPTTRRRVLSLPTCDPLPSTPFPTSRSPTKPRKEPRAHRSPVSTAAGWDRDSIPCGSSKILMRRIFRYPSFHSTRTYRPNACRNGPPSSPATTTDSRKIFDHARLPPSIDFSSRPLTSSPHGPCNPPSVSRKKRKARGNVTDEIFMDRACCWPDVWSKQERGSSLSPGHPMPTPPGIPMGVILRS